MKKLLPPALLCMALAACSKTPPPAVSTSAAPVTRSEINGVQAMLMGGDRKGAKKQVRTLLRRSPMDPSLLLLDQSISGDAKKALGPNSYAYTIRRGDTIEGIASRLLGNPLKAYQLAQYNGLETPVSLIAGNVLRIPGTPAPVARPRPAAERPARPAPGAAPSKPRPGTAAPAAPAAPVRAADPAGARKARAAGLAALNRGDVAGAVSLLRRANALDPGNALIQRDLQRAERIAGSVRARQ